MKRVASNSAVLVGVNFTTAGFGFILSIIVARALGVNDFGRYTLAFAWSFALGLFAEFGLNTLLTRDLAQHRSNTSRYLTAATLIKTCISLILIAGLEIAAPQLSQDPSAVLAIRLAAPLILLNALFGSFTAIFRAFERMTPILFLNASSSLVQLALTFVLVQRGGGLNGVIVLALAIQLAELGAAYVIMLTRFQIRPYSRIDWGLVRQLGRAAFPFAFAGLLGAIQVARAFCFLGLSRMKALSGC